MPVSSPGSGTALRHRAVRLVTRLRPPPGPPRPPRPDQVRALLAVLNDAVAIPLRADAAVASCGEPGPVSGQAARDCGDASSAFLRLRARLRALPLTDPDLVRAQAYAGRLLDYDLGVPPDEVGGRMVHQSVNLAFTVHPDVLTEAARLQLNGLGQPADDLRRLRDALKSDEGAP